MRSVRRKRDSLAAGARGKGWHMGTVVSMPGGDDAGRTAAKGTWVLSI